MAFNIGDIISGLGYAASSVAGRPVQVIKGGLGQAISQTYTPQSFNPYTGTNLQGGSVQGTSSPYVFSQPKTTGQVLGTSTQQTPPQQQQVQQSSGGSLWDQISPYYQGWPEGAATNDFNQAMGGDFNRLLQARGINTESNDNGYQNQVNDAYGGVDQSLNDFYNQVSGEKQGYLDAATSGFNQYQPLYAQSRDTALTGNTQQQNEAKMQEQNALASARQLFNELTQQNQQRFGGGSSSGQFANQILGRGFQQQIGGIQNTAGQNIQKLMDQSNLIKSQYDAQLQSLEAQKNLALQQAQQGFQQRLDQISQMKIQNQQQKAATNLQALQQLRADTQAVQNQYVQFQQQLQATQQVADLNLRNALAGYQAQAGQGVSQQTFAQLNLPTTSGYAQGTGYTPQGATGRKYDKYGNVIG